MPDNTISIDINAADVRRLLSEAPAGLARALRGGINDATALLLRDLSTYPAQRAGSSYKRTGTLRRSWSREIEGGGLEVRGIVGSNENVAPYNREVQDAERQTAMHRRTGWPTVQGVQRNREQEIQAMFQARVDAEMGR